MADPVGDDITSTVVISQHRIRVAESPSIFTITVSNFRISVFDHGSEANTIDLRETSQDNVVEVVKNSIGIISIAEQGPPGPPGPSGGPSSDLDTMVNPEYQNSVKLFEFGEHGVSKISVVSGTILLFERTIVYDSAGVINSIQTDDVINHTRLTKQIEYGPDGSISEVRREVTVWS